MRAPAKGWVTALFELFTRSPGCHFDFLSHGNTVTRASSAGLNIAELCHDEAEDAEDAAKGDPAATKGDPKPTSKRDSTEQGKDQQTDAAKPPATATVTAANGHHHKGAGGVPPGVGAGAGSVTAGGGKGGDVQPLPAFIVQGKLTMTRQAADTNRNLTGIETREAGAISGTVIKAYFKVRERGVG